MKIIGMATVRDEADVLSECLQHALDRHDAIVAVDCGSQDGSGDILERVSDRDRRLIVLPRLPASHCHAVRRHVFSLFRRWLSADDWWSIVDADEFTDATLRDVAQVASREGADHVFSEHVNFYKASEAERWHDGRETIEDRSRPIAERRRFYRMNTSQPRLFRNLRRLRWNNDTALPPDLIRPATRRVIYRHYQYRDIDQLRLRIAARNCWDPASPLVRQEPHWFKKSIEECLSRDDDSTLKEYTPGQPFEADPAMPRLHRRASWKTALLLARAQAKVFRSQAPPTLFPGVDGRELIARAGVL